MWRKQQNDLSSRFLAHLTWGASHFLTQCTQMDGGFSPFSLCFALLYFSLPKTLGNLKTHTCRDDVHISFSHLLSELNKPEAPYALTVANRLYGEKSYQFVGDFLNKTKKLYKAELEPVDFKTSSEEARLKINGWVEKQTQGKIKDVLAQGVLDSLAQLVLVNAFYFKGNWNKKFQESATRDAEFRLNKVMLHTQ
uniref:Serpin domain-containing protein n=1 Tax=Monopterus albus TaxID=43700 RepID=A0A3Q3K533_MONAL